MASMPPWTAGQQAELDRRRALFEPLCRGIRLSKRMTVGRVPCPCCGYPTLSRRASYEICCLCIWEDDGEDDHNTHDWGGGPNGEYTLSQARANVVTFGTMYHPDNNTTMTGNDSAELVALKRTLMTRYEALLSASEEDMVNLWKAILDQERVLRKAEEKRIKAIGRC